MKLLYTGKTKDVYQLEDGNLQLQFKDDVTGENGIFDPGANSVGLTMEGAGRAGLKLSQYFFEILHAKNIPTHYISADVDQAVMIVRPAQMLGNGLEVICRFRAVGSFLRRYGMYATEGQPLDAFVEVTLKDDERQDPPISEEALHMLGVITKEQYQTIASMTKQIAKIVKEELARKHIDLYDIKLEFGKIGDDEQIALIDEISGGNMRAYRDGRYIEPLELTALVID